MIVIHIEKQTDLKQFNRVSNYLNEGKHIYVLIHKTGCPPCMRVLPIWKKIGKTANRNPEIVFLDIEQELLHGNESWSKLLFAGSLEGYPTIRLYKRDIPNNNFIEYTLNIINIACTNLMLYQYIDNKKNLSN